MRLADSIDKTNKAFRTECDILYNSLDAETNSRLTTYNELQSKINAEVVRSGQKDIELEHTLATAIATINSTIDNRITEESLAREAGFVKVNAELDLVHTEVNKKIDNEISSCIDANNSLRNELYKEMKKDYPPIGTIIKTDEIQGKVESHNLLKGTYTIVDNTNVRQNTNVAVVNSIAAVSEDAESTLAYISDVLRHITRTFLSVISLKKLCTPQSIKQTKVESSF